MDNEQIREILRRLMCLDYSTFMEVTGFDDGNYSWRKYRSLQCNVALALVNDFDSNRSNALMDWAKHGLAQQSSLIL